jgi:hypothetical protein
MLIEKEIIVPHNTEAVACRIPEQHARELALLSDPAAASKPRSQFANVQAERQERARLARVRQQEAQLEAERLQAIKAHRNGQSETRRSPPSASR